MPESTATQPSALAGACGTVEELVGQLIGALTGDDEFQEAPVPVAARAADVVRLLAGYLAGDDTTDAAIVIAVAGLRDAAAALRDWQRGADFVRAAVDAELERRRHLELQQAPAPANLRLVSSPRLPACGPSRT